MSVYRAIAAVATFAALSAIAGPYDQPYAIVEVGDPSSVREEFVPAISQIDGKSTRNTRRSDPIEPGKHVVTVRFETGRVTQSPDEVSQKMEINLEGCTRYRVVAKRKDSINWEPKVYSEPIGECAKKFAPKK